MPETLPESLKHLASVLHWLGKHDLCNKLIKLAVWMEKNGFVDIDVYLGPVKEFVAEKHLHNN
jgi:predicted nucleic acid-binding Zn finger protein